MSLHLPDPPISMTLSLPNLDVPVYAALLETIDQRVIFTDLEGRIQLVRNARDAMVDGGTVFLETREPSITDSSAATEGVSVEPGRYVEMMVRDDEPMDSETTAHLFDPFLARKQNDPGTGLRLASVYWMVTQSGGYLFAESSPARSAYFRVLLPASVEA